MEEEDKKGNSVFTKERRKPSVTGLFFEHWLFEHCSEVSNARSGPSRNGLVGREQVRRSKGEK